MSTIPADPVEETPETPAEDTPGTSPEGPEEAPEETEAQVEPTLGFAEYVALQPMRMAAQAALRRWLTLKGHDASGHYPLDTWQRFHQAMLEHH